MSGQERDFTNSFDKMFDFDHDGKIDSLEQYAEIDYLSGGMIRPGDADLALDYFMHSDNPDITFPSSLAENDGALDSFGSGDFGSDGYCSDDYDD